MRAIFITADGHEILTEVDEYMLEIERGRVSNFEVVYTRKYDRIDILRGRTGEIAIYREKVSPYE